jgi:diguanylate cyclase
MIAHDPKLVILSSTIVILGAFTASVLTSNIASYTGGEGRIRISMSALSLGGSLWAMQFVGLLAIEAPLNLSYNPVFLAASAVTAFAGSAAALFVVSPRQGGLAKRLPLAAAFFAGSLALTNYLGLFAIAGSGLRLSWFLALISIAISLQAAQFALWFLFKNRGVTTTLLGAVGLGLCLTAAHYAAIAPAAGLEEALRAVPPDTSGISTRFLAWAATIMMYLLCSICLSVFVIMQFREDMQ